MTMKRPSASVQIVDVIDLSEAEWLGPLPAEWLKWLRWKWKSYEHYRRSSLWQKEIKPRILKRDNYQCQRCKGKPIQDEYGDYDYFLEVHHRSYAIEVMYGLADQYLVTLCEGCHHQVEFDEQGRKRSHQDKERVLAEQDTRTDFPEPKIDLRRYLIQLKPAEWDRMNMNQRRGFVERQAKLKAEKAEKRAKRRR